MITKQFEDQLQEILDKCKPLQLRLKAVGGSALEDIEAAQLIIRAQSAIERISGPTSVYSRHFNQALKEHLYPFGRLPSVISVVEASLTDLRAGYLQSVSELLHGEIFADFLEMAAHLLDEGYKDAAAVIAGGVLESYIRQLCDKHGVDTTVTNAAGDIRPKKADQMNADLAKAGIYSKFDQKSVTAWLDLRNSAAHAKYGDYGKEQVGLMITWARDFIGRNPA